MRVLIVDDSFDLRHVFARVLKGYGFEVCEACDGQEALGSLASFDPDVVLTDVNMPGIDGLELIRRIRAIPAMAEVPIITMTACGTNDDEREARRAGATDFLTKPVDSGVLLKRLHSFHDNAGGDRRAETHRKHLRRPGDAP